MIRRYVGRHRRTAIRNVSLMGVVLALMGALLLALPNTFAAPVGSITASPTFPAAPPYQLQVGVDSVTTVSYTCSNVSADSCLNAYVEIPFNSDILFDNTPHAVGAPSTWDPVTKLLTVNLGDLTPGTTGAFDVVYSTSKLDTPNGYTQTLTPVLKADGLEVTSSVSPYIQWIAFTNVRIAKDIVPPGRAYQGENMTYRISACWDDYGSGWQPPRDWVITDNLPAEVTWVDSNTNGYNAVTHTLTMNSADYTLPTCQSGNVVLRTFEVNVPATTPLDTVVTNTATIDGHTKDGLTFAQTGMAGPLSSTKTVAVDAPNPNGGSWTANWVGAVSADSTWPGDWRPNTSPVVVTNSTVQAVYNSPAESIFSAQYILPTDKDTFAPTGVVDHVACLDSKVGDLYVPTPDVICANPAFHPTSIRIAGGVAIFDKLVLVRTDGSTFEVSQSSTGYWDVPASEIGNIAQIRLGAADGDLQNPDETFYARSFFFTVGGHLDESLQETDRARNIIVSGRKVGTAPAAIDSVDDELRVARAAIGTTKNYDISDPQHKKWLIYSTWSSLEPATGDLIMSDLLPNYESKMEAQLVSGPTQVRLTAPSGASQLVDAYLEVIPDWQGSGRTLVRGTVSKDVLNSHSPGVDDTTATITWEIPFTTAKPDGIWQNVALTTTTSSIGQACLTGQTAPIPDSTNWDERDETTWGCVASRYLTISPEAGSAILNLSKTVKGDDDTSFLASPARGRISETGGSADYKITATNFGSSPLSNVVVYDVFPHPGDTGIISGTSTTPRGSTFTPELASVGALPANVTIAYSSAVNPCRPEVLPTNPGCVNDWSSTPPADLTDVTAIRLTSSATYTTGNGFEVTLSFNAPDVDDDDIAWNTVGGRATNATTSANLQPTEAAKVGIIKAEEEGLTIVKTSDKDPVTTLLFGTLVNWSYTVTNIGPSTVTNIVVEDSKGVEVTCPSSLLVGYDSMVCTGSGRVK